MLPGFGGQLLSEAFVENELLAANGPAMDATRRSLASWTAHTASLGPASSTRALLHGAAAPLAAVLGFTAPAAVESTGEAIAATLYSGSSPVGLLVVPWAERLDAFWRSAVIQAMRRSASWCLLFNGTHLRLVDASHAYAHRHLEFDLSLARDDDRTAFVMRRTVGADALRTDESAPSLRAIVAASDRHASAVCRSLRDGVLAASADLLSALVLRERHQKSVADDSFQQALTVVYRVLFLLFAEARALVPLWHPVYRGSYSIEALRDAAERADGTSGLWDALRAIARLAHSGCVAGDLRVTPFNGRLFSPARTPLAERRDLDDEAARRAILALSTRAIDGRAGRQRIAYRDLGVEQLGAVYETILDYEPRLTVATPARRQRATAFVTLERGSGVRKTTGTFYTPQPIADYVVRRALGPLVDGAGSDQILSLRIVDPAMGSGAFLVAACRFLAAAYEHALVREGTAHAADIGERDRALMRRMIAERCLYGVDVNPMAVQLARLSLWLATLAADRPLSFLDHRLQVGDSLLGAWLRNLQAAPRAGRFAHRQVETPLFGDEAVESALRDAVPVRFSLETVPNDTLEQVRAKERALAAMNARGASLSRWKRIAGAWCASWFDVEAMPAAAFGALTDWILSGRCALPSKTAERYLGTADLISAARRFFHWELEFPEVFFDPDGRRLPRAGFDAVIGNPPWDMLRADTGPLAARAGARADLESFLRFTRGSGVYSPRTAAHANRYQLFLERAIDLTRSGGRLGLVLPSGLTTDIGSSLLRRKLLSRCDVDAIAGIDNHRAIFPIHRSVRFLLVTATAGAPTRRIACRLDVDEAATLAQLGDEPALASDWFPVHVTPALLERISGPDLTIPVLRTSTDVAIVERAAALFPSLGDGAGWGVRFARELNATDDRGAFRPLRPAGGALAIVEGKHVEPFRVALNRCTQAIPTADAARRLPSRPFDRPRLGYRDVASATNRLTLIASVLPAGCVSTHTVYCLRTPLPLHAQHFLCGLFNSLVINYLVRLRVTTHVTTATVERLPIPTRDAAPGAYREIAGLARLLARQPNADAFARLNARVARLYQLSRSELEHVLGTFPLIARETRDAALRAFCEQATPSRCE